MLTRAQNALYWREWSAAKRALMPARETFTKLEETTRRHELHVQAIGEEKSHVDCELRASLFWGGSGAPPHDLKTVTASPPSYWHRARSARSTFGSCSHGAQSP
jgi:hypothetical protein